MICVSWLQLIQLQGWQDERCQARPVSRGSLTANSGTTSLPVSSPGRTIDFIEIMPASPACQIATVA
jgi:hypothetical protein